VAFLKASSKNMPEGTNENTKFDQNTSYRCSDSDKGNAPVSSIFRSAHMT
jgi:hypothetical protein